MKVTDAAASPVARLGPDLGRGRLDRTELLSRCEPGGGVNVRTRGTRREEGDEDQGAKVVDGWA